MIILRQGTTGLRVPLGVFVDETDGKTPETGLTISNTDIKLWKHGATSLVNKNSGGATHMAGGVYYIELDNVDTDTVGNMVIFVHVAGALPIRLECTVMAQNFYDAIRGTDKLQVDAVEVSGATQTARDLGANIDATVSSRAPESGGNVAAIKAKTDQLAFTNANKVDSAIVAAADFAQAAADKVWSTAARTLTNLVVKKNTALNNFMFFMRQEADHVSPATGLSVTAQRSIDGGLFAACANPVVEVGDGVYKINLAASDLNGNVITLKFTAAGADQRTITIVTQD